MKKRISLVLASILILSVLSFPAHASSDPNDVQGTWYLVGVDIEGTTYNPAALGLTMSMELDASGSLVMRMTGEEDQVAAWTYADGELSVIPDDDDAQVFLYSDGALSAEQDGFGLIFGREPAVAEEIVVSPARTDVALDSFKGTWEGTEVEVEGIRLSLSSLSMKITLIIVGNKVDMVSNALGSGSLEGEMDGHELVVSGEDENTMRLTLHEDGRLSLLIEGEDGVIWFELGE